MVWIQSMYEHCYVHQLDMHANYAAGYLWALSDIATTSEIEAMSGINWKRFRDAIIDIQDMATKRLVEDGDAHYLAHIAGDV